MADIRLVDEPQILSKEEFYTGREVKDMTVSSILDQANYLNFYARRSLPYRRISLSNPEDTSVQFIYPVDGEDYSQRRLLVLVGARNAASESTIQKTVTMTSTTMNGSINTYRVADASNSAVSFAVTKPEISDLHVQYYIGEVDITGGTDELIELGGIIDGYGAWELPPGVGSSIAGGISPSTSKIQSGVTSAIDRSSVYPGGGVTSSDVSSIAEESHHGCLSHGRIFFSCGRNNNLSSAKWSMTSGSEHPIGGIYFPPCQAMPGRDYINISAAVWVSSGIGDIAIRSEGLSYTGSYVSAAHSNKWIPWGSSRAYGTGSDVHDGSKSTLTGRAKATGDWLYIVANSSVEVRSVTMWVEEGER